MRGRVASMDWSDAPLCRLERVTDNLCELEERQRRRELRAPWHDIAVFAAGALGVPAAFLVIWIACWLFGAVPL